ncbi:MAG: hypothetical protein HN576_16170 [Bacteriovoracaceae bacterium]|jgi:4-hydroxy 2-oxovalerate aldolase|nr:hypothetical protein [Bacteriovoracaceae bacterium]
MKVLDCTLRDGGYYNNWEFPKDLIQKYLFACKNSNIDYVEVGLRSPKADKFLGPHAYTTEGYLSELAPPKGLKLGVMINTGDFKKENVNLKDFFLPQKQSNVSLVRIATHFTEISESLSLAAQLKELGYVVGLNLMQIGIQNIETIEQTLCKLDNSENIDVLYFADSLGNMKSEDITSCTTLLKKYWKKEIGIHAHNNMGQALTNTLHSIELGATWLDATILGMGRGAGNTQMELLLNELVEKGFDTYSPTHLYPLALNEFESLKVKYQWGSSLLYYLAAKNKIHPSFIQELANNNIYDHLDQINAITALSRVDSTKYKNINTTHVLHNTESSESEEFCLDIADTTPILILANGPSTKKYKKEIESFINIKKPFVISLNFVSNINSDLINLYSLCNPARILSSLKNISEQKKDILIPKMQLDEDLRELISNCNVYNYNLNIGAEVNFDSRGCTIKSPLVLGFTLCALFTTHKKLIYMAGFDGHKDNNIKNDEVNTLLSDLREKAPEIELVSITPTKFNVFQKSIYSNGIIYNI